MITSQDSVAPIEIHEEDLLDVEEQLRFLFHMMKDSVLDVIPFLRGSFSNWIWTNLGIPVRELFKLFSTDFSRD